MLNHIQTFFETLNQCGVGYCHWKSNKALAESMSGINDIDLLVCRQDAARFRSILADNDFQLAANMDGKTFPAVEHYFSLDEASGYLIHIHAYYQVITGESLTKNYHLPLEKMLLQHSRLEGIIRVPTKAAELVIFIVRMMVKHTAIVEFLLLNRHWEETHKELKWLLEAGVQEAAIHLVQDELPSVDPALFARCLASLYKPESIFQRIALGFRLRASLSGYKRKSAMWVFFAGIYRFLIMFWRRVTRSKMGKMLQSGGVVIAFVGSEATGKSTLLSETEEWLGEHFATERWHVGKPQATIFTIVPYLLLPILRRLFPSSRSTKVILSYSNESTPEEQRKIVPITFAIRSVLLAWDRLKLLKKVYRHAANGHIVLCDRYPTRQVGMPDSAQISYLSVPAERHSIRRRLAYLEDKLYRQMPPPDIVVYLTAPLEITIARNAKRGKTEPEDYVRRRHAESSNLDFGNVRVCRVDTNRPFEETLLTVKKEIWTAL